MRHHRQSHFIHLALFAGLVTLSACGGSAKQAEGPSETEQEANAAEQNRLAEEAMLADDQAIDDGFDEEAAPAEAPDAPDAPDAENAE